MCVCNLQSLDSLVRGKELELEQAAEAYRNLQWLKQQSEEKERTTLREKDTLIGQLQAALQTRSQEIQVHTHMHAHTQARTHDFTVFCCNTSLSSSVRAKTSPSRQTCVT